MPVWHLLTNVALFTCKPFSAQLYEMADPTEAALLWPETADLYHYPSNVITGCAPTNLAILCIHIECHTILIWVSTRRARGVVTALTRHCCHGTQKTSTPCWTLSIHKCLKQHTAVSLMKHTAVPLWSWYSRVQAIFQVWKCSPI